MEEKQSRAPIQFTTLSDGLGFHPFSNGLPYASVPKQGKSMIPAVKPERPKTDQVAGTPQFVFPKPGRKTTTHSQPLHKTRPESVPGRASEREQRFYTKPTYFYLFKRSVAYVLDLLVNALAMGGGLWFWYESREVDFRVFSNATTFIVLGMAFVIWSWISLTFQEVVFRTSIGKKCVGLRFEAPALLIFLRTLFFVPSIGFFGAGLLWGLVDSERRCWHDQLTGVQPKETARL